MYKRDEDNKYLIKIENVENILVTFGITKATKNFDRWVTNDGCILEDFSEVLYDSKFIFAFDWRDEIESAIEPVVNALNDININVEIIENDDEENQISIVYKGKKVKIKYAPNNKKTSWKEVIKTIQKLVSLDIIFKQDYFNGGSDTEVYAVLKKDDWKYLNDIEPRVMKYLFKDL